MSRGQPSRYAGLSNDAPRAWLWGRDTDIAVFGGSAALALLAVVWAQYSGVAQSGAFPDWSFIVFILMIDVAHVYATLFRTYLDKAELLRHPVRYCAVPSALLLVLWATHGVSSAWFWTLLAYAAVFHFVRQQVGWVALYRRVAQQGRVDQWIDNAAIYMATAYPLVHWHANLAERRFSWFVVGDFIAFTWPAPIVEAASVAWALSLTAFGSRQVYLGLTGKGWTLGKSLLVGTTAACWFVGIVATNSDFEFTVTNVLIHGVPYFVLLWRYKMGQQRTTGERKQGSAFGGIEVGVGAFVVVVLVLALIEESLWEVLVYQERPWLFSWAPEVNVSPPLVHLSVAVLALPQATHYVLDGIVWRRQDTASLPAQRWALGLPLAAVRQSSTRGTNT